MSAPTATPVIVAGFIRRIAKVWSIASIGFILLMFVGEALHPSTAASFTSSELVGLLFFPVGVCLGMILAWRQAGVGGSITVGSLLAFYAWLRVAGGRWPRGPYFALVAAPGILFLVHWLLSQYGASRGA